MKQPNAGVVSPIDREATIALHWPSVAAMSLATLPLGRILGQLYAIRAGVYIFTVGNVLCLLSAPLALVLYFKRVGPFVARRYRLTTRRVVEERGLTHVPDKSIPLDHFDAIDIVVPSGYAWYHAGDLVFRLGNVEKFLLEGVSRPEAFRQACLKARQAYVTVNEALHQAERAAR